jgi:putative redox protein
MKAVVKQVEGLSLAGKSESNHWVMLDSGKAFGGAEAGNTPMELVLIALGGCTSMDVVSILKKMKQDVRNYRIELDAEKAADHPAVFTKIHLNYIIYGKNVRTDSVQKAIELSMNKYCSISAMLKNSLDITWGFEIKAVD